MELQLCQRFKPLPEPQAKSLGRYAYVITLWGKSREYALGAAVLGHALRKTGTPHSCICLHTNDVPAGYLELLSGFWECRLITHVDTSSNLNFDGQVHRFEKVFTKLRVLELVEFEKVMLLDIDMLILSNIDDLFSLPAPAAMQRGMLDTHDAIQHGEEIDGGQFFQGARGRGYGWGQGTGINAGVMVLQPDVNVFKHMLEEITEDRHPSHVKGNGPEQDYLSRYWADAPWTHIGPLYNMQMHQLFFSLHPDRVPLAERTRLVQSPNTVRVVHFSGSADAKPWQRVLDPRFAHTWPDRRKDEEYLKVFAQEFQGYWLWVKKDREAWRRMQNKEEDKMGRMDYEVTGMYLGDDGEVYRKGWDYASRSWRDDAPVERLVVPQAASDAVMRFLADALSGWFDMYTTIERELGPATLKRMLRGEGTHVAKPARSVSEQPNKWSRGPRSTVLCSAVEDGGYVRFIEGGIEAFVVEGEELRGVFLKRARSPEVLRLSSMDVGDVRRLEEWVAATDQGAAVLLAIVGLQEQSMALALEALVDLGVPQGVPAGCRALAALGKARAGKRDADGRIQPWFASHASADVAFATAVVS